MEPKPILALFTDLVLGEAAAPPAAVVKRTHRKETAMKKLDGKRRIKEAVYGLERAVAQDNLGAASFFALRAEITRVECGLPLTPVYVMKLINYRLTLAYKRRSEHKRK
jgi:hypothetical protein